MIDVLVTIAVVFTLLAVAWFLADCRADQLRNARRREREANRLAESLCRANGFFEAEADASVFDRSQR